MVTHSTTPTHELLVIAPHALKVWIAGCHLTVSVQFADALQVEQFRCGRAQLEYRANEVGNLQFFLSWEDVSKGEDVVENGFADLWIFIVAN